MIEINEKAAHALVAAVPLPDVSDIELKASIQEPRKFTKSLSYEVVGTFLQRRDHFDTTAYLGIGKIAVKYGRASFKEIEWE